jgi:hypothetical protein
MAERKIPLNIEVPGHTIFLLEGEGKFYKEKRRLRCECGVILEEGAIGEDTPLGHLVDVLNKRVTTLELQACYLYGLAEELLDQVKKIVAKT